VTVPGTGQAKGVCVSVVSHGHGEEVLALTRRLSQLSNPCVAQVIVTLNLPEPSVASALRAAAWPFEFRLVENAQPQGFGANHNAAARICDQAAFCVLNPDVGLEHDPFPALLSALQRPGIGCAYPMQVSAQGIRQDTAREVPTPRALARRYVGLKQSGAQPVHWVTGACMLFDAQAFRAINGFDEGYFMYCEDVDICLRLQLAGFSLTPSGGAVQHVPRRASRRQWRHLAWHVRSLLRLWASQPYRDFLRREGLQT